MSVVMHISDTHFGTEQSQVVQALRQLTEELVPEVLVFSGDITQRARWPQFRAAREFVDSLNVPRALVIPGNHDIPLFNLPARLFAPYAGYRRAFGHELEPELDAPDLLVLCVRTTRRYRHVDGEVSGAQIARVAARLRDARPQQFRIVVTHQPVHVIREEDEKNVLHGHEAAVRAWSAAGADLLLSGHIHLPYVRPLSERVAGLPRDVWIANAGTAVSSRIRYEASNSVNVLRCDASGGARRCTVERWDFARDSSTFHVQERTEVTSRTSETS
jgi:predicted MPP superfamily phosphohydrolase